MGFWQIVYIVFIAVMMTTNLLTYDSEEDKSGFWAAVGVYTFLTIVLWRGGFFK